MSAEAIKPLDALKMQACKHSIQIQNAWINTEVFLDWYDNIFITGVRRIQKEIGKKKMYTFA